MPETKPQYAAGMRTEPPVSLPTPQTAIPDATATSVPVLLECIQHRGCMIFRMAAGQDRLIGCNRRKPVSVELIIGNYININPLMMQPCKQMTVCLKMPQS